MTDNIECEICTKKCYAECFDRHVGSVIALEKMTAQMGVKVHIIKE